MEQFTPKYLPLHQEHSGSSEKLLEQSGEDEHQTPEPVRRRFLRRFQLPWLVHTCLFSFNLLFFFVQLLREAGPPTTAACLEQMEVYSPALSAVEYELTKVDGVLDSVTPFTGPGPTVDAAWQPFLFNDTLKPIRLSDEELRKLYKDGRASNVRFSEEDGGGSMGTLNMVHQLHCVNFFRKYTYPADYPEIQDWWNTRPIFVRYHIDHCIELLRQAVTCNADVGVVTYDWVDQFRGPYPDFNMYKKCRNMDRIIDWINRNRLHIERDHLDMLGDEVPLTKPPGATQMPTWERD